MVLILGDLGDPPPFVGHRHVVINGVFIPLIFQPSRNATLYDIDTPILSQFGISNIND